MKNEVIIGGTSYSNKAKFKKNIVTILEVLPNEKIKIQQHNGEIDVIFIDDEKLTLTKIQ